MAKWDLRNKVIVITGATGGLGRALSDAFTKLGAKLALMDLNQDSLDEMVSKYGSSNAGGWVADVRSMEQLDTAMRAAAEKFGHLDVVIAGAGIELFFPTLDSTAEGFERIIDINLVGIYRTFKAAFPWIKQSKGYLLTVSSMAAFVHVPYGSGYSASKAGNYAFTNSLRLEMEPFGIAVGSVHPTWFDTPMVQGVKKRPAWKILMNDDKSLLARMVSVPEVTKKVVSAVENRSDTVIIPWHLKGAAFLSDYLRGVFRWLGPSVSDRQRAYDEFMKETVKL